MLNRLTKTLRPERAAEEEAIEVAAGGVGADLVAGMVERAVRRAWLAGAEAGRREVEEERAPSKV